MPALPAALQRIYERPLAQKFVRYAMTSVVGVAVSQTSLLVMVAGLDWSAVLSNVLAVSLGTAATYRLTRNWVWQRSGPDSFHREVVPFWILTMLGLALSTLCVFVLERLWPDQTLVANIGNVAGYGMLWVAKFIFLDKVLFPAGDPADPPDPTDDAALRG